MDPWDLSFNYTDHNSYQNDRRAKFWRKSLLRHYTMTLSMVRETFVQACSTIKCSHCKMQQLIFFLSLINRCGLKCRLRTRVKANSVNEKFLSQYTGTRGPQNEDFFVQNKASMVVLSNLQSSPSGFLGGSALGHHSPSFLA